MQNLSLENIPKEIWSHLKNGIKDISSAFHFPSLSTINLDGYPTSRTVILRNIDFKKKLISFNTDIRSQKWFEMKNNNNILLHIYDFKNKTQLRITGKAFLNYKNKNWDNAWNSLSIMSKECYSSPHSPSIYIENPKDIDQNIKTIKKDCLDKYKINFGRIDVEVKIIDWLYLLHSGHRRAKFTYNKKLKMTWLAP